MLLDRMMPYLGPVVLVANFTNIFLCLRPKRGMVFTIGVLAACVAAVHCLVVFVLSGHTPLERFSGLLFAPVMLLLFKGQTFQKLFAIFMPYQLGALTTHLADAIVGVSIGYQHPNATAVYVVLSLVMLGGYMLLVRLYGRRLFERLFVESGRGEWVLYSLGAMGLFLLVLTLDWRVVGAAMYFGWILFILCCIAVLCYTIINAHEKAAKEYDNQTLVLQMKVMREQTEDDKKRREDMELLRRGMHHQLGAMMELYRAGKPAQAQAAYAGWQSAQTEPVQEVFCAEPVLNAVFSLFARRAADMGIRLYVNSEIPDTLLVDTIKLSVMVSNALENALAATDKVPERDKRAVRVKLICDGEQLGLEIVNPCAEPVAFDDKGLPVTRVAGHGTGVRSIAAFARQNGYLLSFDYSEGKFAMRLIIMNGVGAYGH